MERILLILGAGGHAKVVADCALASGVWHSVAFLDDRFPELTNVGHWPVVGRVSDMENFVEQYPFMALGVGVNYDALRLQWLDRGLVAGAEFPPVVHSSAVVSPFAKVDMGTVVFAGAVINVDSVIGKACILNTNCSVDHDCVIGSGCHISPGASVAGGVTTGERAWVGMGAQVIQGVSLGADVVVGAGAVVLDDVAVGLTVIGVPARSI